MVEVESHELKGNINTASETCPSALIYYIMQSHLMSKHIDSVNEYHPYLCLAGCHMAVEISIGVFLELRR